MKIAKNDNIITDAIKNGQAYYWSLYQDFLIELLNTLLNLIYTMGKIKWQKIGFLALNRPMQLLQHCFGG